MLYARIDYTRLEPLAVEIPHKDGKFLHNKSGDAFARPEAEAPKSVMFPGNANRKLSERVPPIEIPMDTWKVLKELRVVKNGLAATPPWFVEVGTIER